MFSLFPSEQIFFDALTAYIRGSLVVLTNGSLYFEQQKRTNRRTYLLNSFFDVYGHFLYIGIGIRMHLIFGFTT